MFLLHKFRPCLIKQMILVSIKKWFPKICRVGISTNRMNTTLETVSRFVTSVCRKTCSDSIHCGTKTSHEGSLKQRDLETNLSSSFFVWSDKLVFVVHLLLASVHTPHQVSLILQDSEKNGASSFLVQSDKLVLVHHFPLVPVYTVVKPASYVIARLRSPSGAASQCSLPYRRLSVPMIGCRTTVWHQFPQYHPRRHLFDSVGWPASCWAWSSWAHNLWRSGIPQKSHPAVDLHCGYLDTWTTGLGSEKRTTETQEK